MQIFCGSMFGWNTGVIMRQKGGRRGESRGGEASARWTVRTCGRWPAGTRRRTRNSIVYFSGGSPSVPTSRMWGCAANTACTCSRSASSRRSRDGVMRDPPFSSTAAWRGSSSVEEGVDHDDPDDPGRLAEADAEADPDEARVERGQARELPAVAEIPDDADERGERRGAGEQAEDEEGDRRPLKTGPGRREGASARELLPVLRAAGFEGRAARPATDGRGLYRLSAGGAGLRLLSPVGGRN